jgi:hypothetical protein
LCLTERDQTCFIPQQKIKSGLISPNLQQIHETYILNTADKKVFKQQLKESVLEILRKRIATSEHAMQLAQESANSDDKSSAGDKYETSRSMGQRDSDMHAGQLRQAQQEMLLVTSLQTDQLHEQAGMGTVVVCKDFIFFIALGLGSIELPVRNGSSSTNQKIILLSAQAPLAAGLKSKKKGDSFLMAAKKVEITDLF